MGIKVKCEEQQAIPTVRVEEGTYSATLKKIEARTITVREGDNEVQRPVLQWTFEVETEEGLVEIQGLTSQKFSTGRNPSKFYRWACRLLGRKINPGDELDTDELIGKDCMVVVEDRKLRDGTIVSRVTDVLRVQRKKKKGKAKKKKEEPEEEEVPEEEVPEEEEAEEEEVEA